MYDMKTTTYFTERTLLRRGVKKERPATLFPCRTTRRDENPTGAERQR